jgi:hypothetical protein
MKILISANKMKINSALLAQLDNFYRIKKMILKKHSNDITDIIRELRHFICSLSSSNIISILFCNV